MADPGDLRPRRLVPHEEAGDGVVVLLRPKILSPRWAWLLRHLARPVYRVRLDLRGSFLWLQCDGVRSVREVAAVVQERFEDPPQDAEARAWTFLWELARGGFLALEPPPA